MIIIIISISIAIATSEKERNNVMRLYNKCMLYRDRFYQIIPPPLEFSFEMWYFIIQFWHYIYIRTQHLSFICVSVGWSERNNFGVTNIKSDAHFQFQIIRFNISSEIKYIFLSRHSSSLSSWFFLLSKILNLSQLPFIIIESCP